MSSYAKRDIFLEAGKHFQTNFIFEVLPPEDQFRIAFLNIISNKINVFEMSNIDYY